MIRALLFLIACFMVLVSGAQIAGMVKDQTGNPLQDVMVFVEGSSFKSATDPSGHFSFTDLEPGSYQIVTFYPGFETVVKEIDVHKGRKITLSFQLEELSQELASVTVEDTRTEELGINWLQSVSGAAIYEAKKTELIELDQIIANKAANVSRQVYARVPGLNIWENDGAGVQLGIGGRGLSPNRTSNFNVRQNGYDISADALGYPESYYTPPVQALDKIEIVRGAAGLQYGTQFGGMLNFDFKEGPKDKKVELNTINTVGSFGLFNTFNSIGGTVGKVNYYGFYQYKTSEGWRPNAGLDQHNVFGSVTYNFNPFLRVTVEHTHMSYLAQQPGGLTDAQFLQNPRQSNRERNWFQVGWNLTAMEWNYRISPYIKFNNRSFHLSSNRYAVGNLGRIDRPDNPDENRNLLKDDYNNVGNEFRTIIHYPLLGQKSILLIGNRLYFGETLRDQGEGTNAYNADFGFINPEEPDGSSFIFPSKNVAFFAENIFNLTPKFSITPGVRYEFIQTDARGYYYNQQRDIAGNILFRDKIDEDKTKVRSFALFGVGLSYKHSDKLEAYSNFSQNFRAINFNDIRVDNPSLIVDSNIDDERGFNMDLGVRGALPKKFRYDVSLFYLSYRDRIGNALRTGADPRFTFYVPRTYRFRTNVADARIIGLETYVEGNLFQLIDFKPKDYCLTAFLNFAAIRAIYQESNEPSLASVEGNQVELVPAINLKSGLTFKYKKLGVSWLISYVSRQYSDATNADDSPTAVEGIIPAYSVMDISLSYKWKFITLETGVNNLTNEFYFTRRAAGYPGPGIIPSDGRSGYLTLGIRF